MATRVYDEQMYNYMRNTVVPLIQSILSVLENLLLSVEHFIPWLQRGFALAVFVFLYFVINKFVQMILYR